MSTAAGRITGNWKWFGWGTVEDQGDTKEQRRNKERQRIYAEFTEGTEFTEKKRKRVSQRGEEEAQRA
jgi:hypothetical protein